MKIVTLVENTTSSPDLRCKHGLSLYIETAGHKILFDLGPNGLFAENAKKLNVDLAKVDTVVISHGHKDHGGGLKTFLEINKTAKIYIRKQALAPHYIKVLGLPFGVGVDASVADESRFVFTDEITKIDEELMLFSGVSTEQFFSESNRVLFAKKQGKIVADTFDHEHNLLITENDKKVLVAGCSHAGIVNIQRKAEVVAGQKMSALIGGFHLYNPPTKKYESATFINEVAEELAKTEAVYYTGHCTGVKAYDRMKNTLGERLQYLSTGSIIEIPEWVKERGEKMYIIVGLGNPGLKYNNTRHNIGFSVIDAIANKYNIDVLDKKHKALVGKGVIEGQRVILAKPQTFMNLSGESVRELIDYYKVDPESELIVIYDDISLPVGGLRIRTKGSAGGHNGIKNILQHLGGDVFLRIKVGVGEKPSKMDLADYVLGHFTEDEIKAEKDAAERCIEAVKLLLSDEVDEAMNRFNRKVVQE